MYDPEEEQNEGGMSKEERDKLIEFIIQTATDADIEDHLKAGFQKFGIEGTEEVFMRVYDKYPVLKERYKKAFDRLLRR